MQLRSAENTKGNEDLLERTRNMMHRQLRARRYTSNKLLNTFKPLPRNICTTAMLSERRAERT